MVSKGPAPVKVPKLAGQTQAAATAALTKAGLKVTTSQDYSKSVPSGSVISTSPGPGASVAKGGTVNLVVSQGPPLVKVPDVYKMSEADAKARLKAAGFKVDVTYPIGITPFGRVVSQSVDAGKSIPWGSTIEIQVV